MLAPSNDMRIYTCRGHDNGIAYVYRHEKEQAAIVGLGALRSWVRTPEKIR